MESYCTTQKMADIILLPKHALFDPLYLKPQYPLEFFQHSSTALSNGLSVRLNYSSMKIMVAGLTPF